MKSQPDESMRFPHRLHVKVDDEFFTKLEVLRRNEKQAIPNQSEMIRLLVERAYDIIKKSENYDKTIPIKGVIKKKIGA